MPKLMELARRRQAWNEAHPGAHPDAAIDAWHAMAEELGL